MNATMIPESTVNGYRLIAVAAREMGDWQGDEELAMRQFHRQLVVLAETLAPNDGSAALADAWTDACHEAWDTWGSEGELLTATDDDFQWWAAAHA